MTYLTISIASLREFEMFLFSYYKTNILIWLPCLFIIYTWRRMKGIHFYIVNCENTVRNCKYVHWPYPRWFVYISSYNCLQGRWRIWNQERSPFLFFIISYNSYLLLLLLLSLLLFPCTLTWIEFSYKYYYYCYH
jgi:hypothetical protein